MCCFALPVSNSAAACVCVCAADIMSTAELNSAAVASDDPTSDDITYANAPEEVKRADENGADDKFSADKTDEHKPKATTPTPQRLNTLSAPSRAVVDPVEAAEEARRARVVAIYLPNHPYVRLIALYSLQYVFALELFFYWFPIFINYGVCAGLYRPGDEMCTHSSYAQAIFVFSLFHTLSFVVICFGTALLWFELSHHIVKPAHLTSMYFAIIVHYASWYQLIYAITTDALYVLDTASDSGGPADPSTDLANKGVLNLYLSISIMTTVGFGDVYPSQWYGKIIAISQMVMGLLYTTGIFGIGLDHFRTVLMANTARPIHQLPFTPWLVSLREKYPRINWLRKFFVRNLLLTTAIIQILLMCFLLAAYGHDQNIFDSSPEVAAVNFICIFLEFILFVVIVFSSFRLVRSINTSAVSLSFLLQSYLSVTLLFGGVFFTIFLFAGQGSYILRSFNDSTSTTVPKALGEFIWFSFVVMSTTGFGDVVPVNTAARIFVAMEMLISVFYLIIVLGIGMARTMHAWNRERVELPPLPEEADEDDDVPDDIKAADAPAANVLQS